MNLIENIRNYAFHDSITIYWEKGESLQKGIAYQIFCDGIFAGTTDKTHYTIENLEAETGYRIQVQAVYEKDEVQSVNAAKALVAQELYVYTAAIKEKIDVTKSPYCAVGDGKTMNTAAIQKAIDDCKENQMVYIPEGTFMTGALRLHSDMELYLEEGAHLLGTAQVKDYLPKIWSRFEGTELFCYSSLLNLGELNHKGGYSCKNVVIRGKGTIESGGKELAKNVIRLERELMKEKIAALGDEIKQFEKPDTIPGRVRPRLINMSNCQNILLEGVTLKNGACWNIHMIYCNKIVTSNCTVFSEEVWNGDGWNPDSSNDCTLFNTRFFTGDDSVAIKSGKNPEGNEVNRPCSKIRVFDCSCAYGHGITMGSEMSGGIDDVKIWDCDMSQSMCGFEIKGTSKRGGYVRNVHILDSSCSRIMFHSVGYNNDGIGAPVPPVFKDCVFDHIAIRGEYFDHDRQWYSCDAIEVCGFEEKGYEVSNIIFRDIDLCDKPDGSSQTISLKLCENITFERIHCMPR